MLYSNLLGFAGDSDNMRRVTDNEFNGGIALRSIEVFGNFNILAPLTSERSAVQYLMNAQMKHWTEISLLISLIRTKGAVDVNKLAAGREKLYGAEVLMTSLKAVRIEHVWVRPQGYVFSGSHDSKLAFESATVE